MSLTSILSFLQCSIDLWCKLAVCISLQVKAAYMNFLNHCYIDTEVEMKEIYTSNHMWTLFENFLVDIVTVCTATHDRVHADKVSLDPDVLV